MAVSAATLIAVASDLSGTATSLTTGSVVCTAGRLVLICIESVDADLSSPQLPTISAGPIATGSVQSGIFGSGSFGRLSVYRGMASGTGTFTIDFAGIPQLAIVVSIFELTGVDTSGTNGSGAIVQAPAISTGSSTAPLATLAALGSANNAVVGIAGVLDAGGGALGLGSGWTGLHTLASGSDGLFRTQWKLNDNTVDFTLATARSWGVLGVEVKAAVAATGPTGAQSITVGSFMRSGPRAA